MSLIVRFRRLARREYDDAVDWYESQGSGLGMRFFDAVGQTLDEISDHPKRFPVAWKAVREASIPGWPHNVYYEVSDDHVLVIALYHHSRDPAIWQKRIW